MPHLISPILPPFQKDLIQLSSEMNSEFSPPFTRAASGGTRAERRRGSFWPHLNPTITLCTINNQS
ncbi:hypothetical protein T484DRAFT_1970466 [Baffinella frigidus]|nr:hypothetical protein T484DRAFT_1970466 [Cryptophyta sp. CCMP2293]